MHSGFLALAAAVLMFPACADLLEVRLFTALCNAETKSCEKECVSEETPANIGDHAQIPSSQGPNDIVLTLPPSNIIVPIRSDIESLVQIGSTEPFSPIPGSVTVFPNMLVSASTAGTLEGDSEQTDFITSTRLFGASHTSGTSPSPTDSKSGIRKTRLVICVLGILVGVFAVVSAALAFIIAKRRRCKALLVSPMHAPSSTDLDLERQTKTTVSEQLMNTISVRPSRIFRTRCSHVPEDQSNERLVTPFAVATTTDSARPASQEYDIPSTHTSRALSDRTLVTSTKSADMSELSYMSDLSLLVNVSDFEKNPTAIVYSK